MVDKLTPRLGLPEPFLTNPLKVDVGRLQQALEMIDTNAVMLTDWDITADGWQKMGTIKGLAQGKIAASLMVVTGTGFANILFQTGDGTVTTVGDPARMTVSAQTSLGANAPTILGGRVVETAADEYEIWFNIAIGTSPRKWSGLLITGNGAKIDWTHAMGTQPSDGVELQISRVLTSFDVASDTRTDIGTLLSTGHLGSGVVQLDYLTTVDLKGRMWKTGELVRIKKADATDAKGFPPALVSADPSATGWFIRCLSINDTRTVKEFEFTSESAGIIRAYKARLSGTTWSVAKVYTSLDKPTANDISALGMRAPVTGTNVVNLNDMYGPDYYGATAIKNTASAVAANNYPFDEVGTVLVLPFGDTFSCTQLYVTQSGRVAARSYDGSTWTTWRKQANSGVNDDITQLTALSGPLRLGGDAVGDYDAVTMRQLRSVSGGAGGPSMNGVMNYGVGDFHLRDSRAYIQPYEVVSDGQLLNRADWPELWAYAQMLTPISDAEWLADPAKRGNYSLGDGTITFRVPDRNGVQPGSVPALFGRGDGGTSSYNGKIEDSAAPNIIGSFTTSSFTYAGQTYPTAQRHSGAFTKGGSVADSAINISSVTAGQLTYGTDFYASNSSPIYGRSNQEVRPRSFYGVWVIRASGGFVAANTSWSVINGDTTLPGNNTEIRGGAIRSVYQVAGADHMSVEVRAQGTVGGGYTPVIEMVSPSGGSPATRTWTLPQAAGELLGRDSLGTSGAKIPLLNTANTWGAVQTVDNAVVLVNNIQGTDLRDKSGPVLYSRVSTAGISRLEAKFFANFDGSSLRRAIIQVTSDATIAQTFAFSEVGDILSSKGSVQWSGSDVRIKSDFQPPALGHQKRIAAIGVAEYRYKGNSYTSRGFLAQQMATIDERYVYAGGEGVDDDGNAFDILNVDTRAVVADLVSTVQDLLNEISGLKTEISRLKS